jgi:hypothetical protein
MSEGSEADKFLNFPSPADISRNREAAQTAGRLFFGYFLLAKQKKVTCRRATPGLVAKYTNGN